jgi:hypothetical protein
MPSQDRQVTSRHVLRSLLRLKRQGRQRALEELEQVEPDLAEFLMEEVSLVHRKLLELAGPPRRTRWLARRVESMALVLVASLRQAHYEMWKDAAAGTALESLDSTLTEGEDRTEENLPRDKGVAVGPDEGTTRGGRGAPSDDRTEDDGRSDGG